MPVQSRDILSHELHQGRPSCSVKSRAKGCCHIQRQRPHSGYQRRLNPRLEFRYSSRNTIQSIVRSLNPTPGTDEAQRFDLRFFRPFRADLSIRKSLSFFPPLIAATSQRGLAPRPAQVSPNGPRYFGGTFFPFNALPPCPRATAIALSILSNCS